MRKLLHYNGTFTAGTKVTSATTGFTVQQGFAGITRVWKSGDIGETLEITFPGNEHEFAKEEVPVHGEIAVETRVNDIVLVPCFWHLPEGTKIDCTPQGAESSTEGNIFIELGTEDEFTEPARHWVHADWTTGTTADDAELTEIPRSCHTLWSVIVHGANLEYTAIRMSKSGSAYFIIGNHGTTHAVAVQLTPQVVNLPKETDHVYLADQAAGHGAGAAADFHFSFLYE